MMVERRQHKRYEVEDINGCISIPIDASILNMSLEGVAIESTTKLDVNKQLNINITRDDKTEEFIGNVVWCSLNKTILNEKNETVPVYQAGIMLNDILSSVGNSLLMFMEESHSGIANKRIFQRFKISSKKNVNISYSCDFRVKVISLAGMLIDTKQLIDLNAPLSMKINLGDIVLDQQGRAVYANQYRGRDGDILSYLGVEFLDMTRENREVLKKYLSQKYNNNK